MSDSVSICVIGSGYVGLVAAVCFAEMGHRVLCVDNDEARVETPAPGRRAHLRRPLAGVAGQAPRAAWSSPPIWAAPWKRARLSSSPWAHPRAMRAPPIFPIVEAVVSEIARSHHGYKVIVEKSTVPVYTNEWIRRVLHRHGVDAQNFDVVSNPEFLREGTAVVDFLHPDRIVVGSQLRARRRRSAPHLPAAHRRRLLHQPDRSARYLQRAAARPSSWSPRRRVRRSSNTPPMLFWP